MISQHVASSTPRERAVATATLRIDMIADLICPWCYLGKRRLDEALASVRGPSLLKWNPFQLNPEMPPEGMGLEQYLASRFGDAKAVQPGLDELTRVGEIEGVRFRFDRLVRVPNTMNAHCLLLHAETEGVATADLLESIFKSFFEDGSDISDRDVLIRIGQQHGLAKTGIVSVFDDESLRRKVRAQEAQVRRGGVTGVPNFLVNDRLFVMGAQPASALVDVFDRVMFGAESGLPLQGSSVH